MIFTNRALLVLKLAIFPFSFIISNVMTGQAMDLLKNAPAYIEGHINAGHAQRMFVGGSFDLGTSSGLDTAVLRGNALSSELDTIEQFGWDTNLEDRHPDTIGKYPLILFSAIAMYKTIRTLPATEPQNRRKSIVFKKRTLPEPVITKEPLVFDDFLIDPGERKGQRALLLGVMATGQRYSTTGGLQLPHRGGSGTFQSEGVLVTADEYQNVLEAIKSEPLYALEIARYAIRQAYSKDRMIVPNYSAIERDLCANDARVGFVDITEKRNIDPEQITALS